MRQHPDAKFHVLWKACSTFTSHKFILGLSTTSSWFCSLIILNDNHLLWYLYWRNTRHVKVHPNNFQKTWCTKHLIALVPRT